MKVERKKVEPAFEPIIITLETREEAEEMMAIMSHSAVVNSGSPLRKLSDELYQMGFPLLGLGWNNLCLRLKEYYSRSR